ncbi:hypothetical protein [Ureibacillus chungkukjangi]
MPYIEENETLLKKALGDYEIVSEEMEGYRDTEGTGGQIVE